MSFAKTRKFISDFPELMKEWDYNKNKNLKPEEASYGSGKKVWWVCAKGHEWEAKLNNRTALNQQCPYCSHNKASIENSIQGHPEILFQWNYKKNKNIKPSEVSFSAHQKIWWVCDKGHEWFSSPNRRSTWGGSCPYCSGRKICEDTCLEKTHPHLMNEWDYEKNDKFGITPQNISRGNKKDVWWRCDKGHEWSATTNSRTNASYRKENGCPYCSGRRVCLDNCLATLNPDLAKKWNYPKNEGLLPQEITAYSKKKVWWICPKKHEWIADVSNRNLGKTGCPICCESKGEKRIAEVLESKKLSYKREFRIKECRRVYPLPFDFRVEKDDKFFLIEYQGSQHYSPSYTWGSKNPQKDLDSLKERDAIKKKYCLKNNIPLLIISYKSFKKIEKRINDFLSKLEKQENSDGIAFELIRGKDKKGIEKTFFPIIKGHFDNKENAKKIFEALFLKAEEKVKEFE